MTRDAVDQHAPLDGSPSAGSNTLAERAGALNSLLADVLALYLKTKSFHWHMSGAHFRDYHLLLDEQAAELFAMTDAIAERVRKIGAPTLGSLGEAHRLRRIGDSDAGDASPAGMLAQLCADNRQLLGAIREAHTLSSATGDIATASLLEAYVDEGERRIWFLLETSR